MLSRVLRGLDDSRRDDLLPRERVKKIGQRARAVLSARSYERFLACLEELEPGIAGAFRRQISRQDSLGRAVRSDLLKHIANRFPGLQAKPETPPWERDDVLYVTEAGLVRKQKEVDHHVNVKMKENARAIGRAAEHGDLSENAEYKFALEERDLLRARLAQMNAELAKAEVMSPTDVPNDHVGVGTRAVFKRVSDGESYQMGFVGPWEADPTENYFNYQAPICQQVLGARVGDVVEFEHGGATGRYEIVGIHNLLAEMQEHTAG
jgi:transcription elongation factor GreA